MKLHLPSSLRKALLTCLAALTSLLPATLASGAFLSSGAFCSLALAEDAIYLAADDEEDDDEDPYGVMPIAFEPPAGSEYTAQTLTSAGTLTVTEDANTEFILESGFTGGISVAGGANAHVKISNRTGEKRSFSGGNPGTVKSIWLAEGLFDVISAVGGVGQEETGGIFIGGGAVQLRANEPHKVGSAHGIYWHIGSSTYQVAEGEDAAWNNASLVVTAAATTSGTEGYSMYGKVLLEEGAKIVVAAGSMLKMGQQQGSLASVKVVGNASFVLGAGSSLTLGTTGSNNGLYAESATLTLNGAESGDAASVSIYGPDSVVNSLVVSGNTTLTFIGSKTVIRGLTSSAGASYVLNGGTSCQVLMQGACNISADTAFSTTAGGTLQLGTTGAGNGLYASGANLTFSNSSESNDLTVTIYGPDSVAGVLTFNGRSVLKIAGGSITCKGLVGESTASTSSTANGHNFIIENEVEASSTFLGSFVATDGAVTIQKKGDGKQIFGGSIGGGNSEVHLTHKAGVVEMQGEGSKALTSLSIAGGATLKISSGGLSVTGSLTLDTDGSGDAVIELAPTAAGTMLTLADNSLASSLSGLKIKVSLADSFYEEDHMGDVADLISYAGEVDLNEMLDTSAIRAGYALTWNADSHIFELTSLTLDWNRGTTVRDMEGWDSVDDSTPVIFDMVAGSGHTYFPEADKTITQPVRIDSIYLSDGHSNYDTGHTYTFQGDVYGEGDFVFNSKESGAPTGQRWVFEGDMSNYTGNFSITYNKKDANWNENRATYLRFKGNTSGSGSISIVDGSEDHSTADCAVLDVQGATMNSSFIHVTNLLVSTTDGHSTGTFNVDDVQVSTSFKVADGATAQFNTSAAAVAGASARAIAAGTARVDIAAPTTLGANSTLGIADGVTVAMSGSLTLGAGSSIANSGSLTLSLAVADYTESAAITLANADLLSTLISSGIQISLTGSFGEEESSASFQLFGGDGLSIDSSLFDDLLALITDKGDYGRDAVLSLSEDGTLTLAAPSLEDMLVYNDTAAFTWEAGGDSHPWNGGSTAFTNGKGVVLGAEESGSTGANITVKGALEAGRVHVLSGTWILAADAAGGSLSADATCVETGAGLTLSSGDYSLGALSGAGTITYNGGSLSIRDASAFAGQLVMGAAWTISGDLTFGEGGCIVTNANKLTISGELCADIEHTQGTTAYSTVTLQLEANSAVRGGVTLTGQPPYISLGNNSTIDKIIVNTDAHDVAIFMAEGIDIYIGTVENVSTVKIQGPNGTARTLHFTGAFDGNTSTVSGNGRLEFGQKAGYSAGNVSFDGLVSNMTYIKNDLRKAAAKTDGEIYFSGGLNVGANLELSAMANTTFHIRSVLSGSADINKTGAGALAFESGNWSFAGYTGTLTLTDGTLTVSSDMTGLSGLTVAASKTLTVSNGATLGTTAASISGVVALTEGATLEIKGGDVSIGATNLTATAAETLKVSGGTVTMGAESFAGSVAMAGGNLNWEGNGFTINGSLSIDGGSTFSIAAGKSLTAATLSNAATNGTLSVGEGASATLVDANGATLSSLVLGSSTSRVTVGGQLTLQTLSAAGGAAIHIGITGDTATVISGLTGVTNTGGSGLIVLHLSAEEVQTYLAGGSSAYYSLFAEDGWQVGWESLFEVQLDGSGDNSILSAELQEDGRLHLYELVKNLVWAGGESMVWQTGGAGWNLQEGGTAANFAQKDNVFFATSESSVQEVRIAGAVQSNAMTIQSGAWSFSNNATGDSLRMSTLTLEAGSSATFGGALALTASGVEVGEGATLSITATGAKSLGGVHLAAGAEFIVNVAGAWSTWADGQNIATGEGTLVYNALGLVENNAGLNWLISSTLSASAEQQLEALRLRGGTDLRLSTDGHGNNLRTIKHIYVEDGNSIGIDSNSMNISGAAIPVLHLVGEGVDTEDGGKKGAFYHIESRDRAVTLGMQLDADATYSITDAAGSITMNGAYNGGGHTLTKTGAGTMILNGAGFSTVASSTGAFDVQEGAISLNFTSNKDTALANYSFHVGAAGSLQVRQTGVVLKALAGEVGGTVAMTDTIARTLKINNGLTRADANNTYAGSLAAGLTLELIGGYEKLTGALTSEASLVASGGTLAVAGSLQAGQHVLTVGNGATLDMAGAAREEGTGITYLAAAGAAGTIANLSLSSADKLSFAEARVGSHLTLSNATFSGGTIAFDFVAANGGWATGGELASVTYSGDIVYNGTEKIELELNPYGRSEGGAPAVLAEGSYLLIEDFGSADNLEHYGKAAQALGRMEYSYRVESGNLYLDVQSAVGLLTWEVPAGGNWNDANAWNLKGSLVSFEEGDMVTFTTMRDAFGSIITEPVTISVGAAPVSVGGITVTGATGYVLDGDITGTNDVGLEVGTLGAEGVPFSGTLILTGNNSWTGNNELNSGTIIAQHANALSHVDTLVSSAATLVIDCGDEFGSTLNMQGGVVTNTQDVTVRSKLTGGAFNAATDTTLTVRRVEGSGAGFLRVNTGDTLGTVRLLLDTATGSASAMSVSAGTLSLNCGGSDPVTFSVAGTVNIASLARLVIEKGVAFSGNMRAAEGSVAAQDGSSLTVTGANTSIGTLTSYGAALEGSSEGSGTRVGNLVVNGDTTLRGGWEIRSIAQEQGAITIENGTTAITPTHATEVNSIVVQDGAALRGGSEQAELTVKQLALGSGEGETARLTGGSVLTTSSLTISNGVVAEGAVVTLAGASDKNPAVATVAGSGSALNGHIILEDARMSIADGAAMEGSLEILRGSVSVESDAVAGYASLSGSSAQLHFNGCAASTVVTMASGSVLQGTENFLGTIIVDDTDSAISAGVFDLGGLGADASVNLKSLRSASRVTGVGYALNLVGDNVMALGSAQRSRQNALISFSSALSTGLYALADDASLTINVSSIVSSVIKDGTAGSTYYVFNKGIMGTDWSKESVTFEADLFLSHIDVEFSAIEGSITFTYNGPLGGVDIFYSSDQEDSDVLVTEYGALDNYAGVVLDRKTTIDLTGKSLDSDHPDGLLLKNLTSTEEGTLAIKGDGSGATLVTIRNNVSDADLEQYAEQHELDIQNVFTVRGEVNVEKADLQISHRLNDGTSLASSRTRMMGKLSVAEGQLLMGSGELELNGHADVESVSFTEGANGQIIISGCTASMGSINLNSLAAPAEGAHAEHIRLENDGVLELKNGAMVATGITIGNTVDALGGTVRVTGKSMAASGAALQHVVLHLEENSRLSITPAAQPRALAAEPTPTAAEWNLVGLSGSGELASTEARDLSISVQAEDRIFSGNLASYNGTMVIGPSEYWQVFSGVLGNDTWNLTNSGKAKLDLMGARARNSVTMGALSLNSGSHTWISLDMLNLDSENSGMKLGSLYIEDGAKVTIAQYGDGIITLEGDDDNKLRIALGSITVEGEMIIGNGVEWDLVGVRNYVKGSLEAMQDADGNFYLEGVLDNTNRYARYADNGNSASGAGMLWSVKEATDDLYKLSQTLNSLLNSDDEAAPSAASVAKANRLMAAAAGAGTAALGEALGADLERQMRAVRNRTTSLAYGAERNSSVWLNAESNYHKQDADGLLPGFKLNGWGGTVGAHTEIPSAHTTVGVALTAMYNDVESDSADRIKGDMDTYYLSAFAQVAHRAWRHTFLATVGTASVDVNRTVSHDLGSYTTSASTDGFAFGLLYELGYTLPLRSDYSVCLQPIVNVAWRVTSIDAYTEKGGNAALHVGEQNYSTITFGAGARLQAAVGSNIWNRTGLLEARALVKADAGDRRGETETAFISAPEAVHGKVKSAERGAVGIELGAGITVPTGEIGSVFADFSAELRSDYTNLNATVGYKINF